MKTKELFKRTLLVLIVLIVCAAKTFAQDYYDFGSVNADGKELFYTIISNATVTVHHAGAGISGDVVVPSTVEYNSKTYTVTRISNSAFRNEKDISSITLPNTIEKIGMGAFVNCESLSSLNIPENVTSISAVVVGQNEGTSPQENFILYFNAKNANGPGTSQAFNLGSNCEVIFGENVEHIPDCFLSGSIESINIPSSVISIGHEAFQNCTNLSFIEIPENVTRIDDYVFNGCTNLTTIVAHMTTPATISSSTFPYCRSQTLYIPEGCLSQYTNANYWGEFMKIEEPSRIYFEDANVESICIENWDGDNNGYITDVEMAVVRNLAEAFYEKSQIVSFNELQYFTGLKNISENAFNGCSNLTTITLPENVSTIGENAFMDCSNLITITVPEKVTTIGDNAFKGCSNLTTIILPLQVTTIGDNAFQNCNSLNTISLPKKLEIIGNRAFMGCSNLASIDFEFNENLTIGERAFANCTSLTAVTIHYFLSAHSGAFAGCTSLTTVYFGAKVVESNTFQGCTNLSSVTLGDKVTEINEGAFRNCTSLTSIKLPSSLEYIGESVFEGTGISETNIPSSVNSIQGRAFYGCNNLWKVTVNWSTPLEIPTDAFPNRTNQILIVPAGTKETYRSASVWKDFNWIREVGAQGIGFADANVEAICLEHWDLDMDGLLQAEEATQVTDLGTAFQGNTAITSFDELQYFTGLTSFGTNAFNGCTNLQSIVIPEGVTELLYGVFVNCSSLTTIEIPSSVTSIAGSVFYGCTSLKSVKVNWTEPIAPNTYAFPNRANQVLYVPTGTKAAYQAADIWKDFLLIRETGASIPAITFADAKVKTICLANWDYDGDGELQTDEAAQVADLRTVFQGRTDITSFNELQYFTGLTSIASYAFDGCTNLQSIVIPEGVAKLWPNSFYNCSSLASIEIPGSVTEIMGSAFYGCSSMESVTVNWTTPIVPASNAFPNRANQVLYVPEGTKATYQSADIWKEFRWALVPGESLDNYAIYNTGAKTLTFYHDGQALSRPGKGYLLNTGDNTPEWNVNSTNVTTVVFDASFADARPTSTAHWFEAMSSLGTITGLANLNTSEVTTMTSMFKGCSNSRLTLDPSKFNTAKVTDMSNMFSRCSALTDLNLAGWNTATVTDMSGMFELCYNLGTITVGEGWTVVGVTSSENMFHVCSSLTGEKGTRYQDANPMDKTYAHIDGGESNPGYLTDINGPYAALSADGKTLTFYNDGHRLTRTETTYGLNAGYSNQPGWMTDGSNAAIEHVVFDASFADARPVSTAYWFFGMSNLSDITGMEYLNTSEVILMSGMFSGCSSLTNIDLNHFNTSKVTNMPNMFRDCTGLTSLDLIVFDTQNVLNMRSMFDGCSNMTTIYAGAGWNTDKVNAESSEYMFRGCTSLMGDKGTAFDANHTDKEYARIDGGQAAPGYFSGAPAYAALSSDGTTLTFYCDMLRSTRGTTYDLNQPEDDPDWYNDGSFEDITTVVFDPSFAGARPIATSSWFYEMEDLTTITGMEYLNTSEVTDMSYMFNTCLSLTSLDLSHFDTGKVTNMRGMFMACGQLTSLDLGRFNTANVTNMGYMFYNCYSLTSLAVGDLNTGNVEYMDKMFAGCTGLTEIDFSGFGFKTTNVVDMNNMFSGCSRLTSLNTWRAFANGTRNVIDMSYMFRGCSGLTSLDLTYVNTESATNLSHMFDGCTNLTEITLNKNYFTTSNVTDMTSMFMGCSSLQSLDLSSFNTENLTTINRMFQNCSSLKQIDLSSFNTDKIKNRDMDWLFANCSSLERVDVTSFNTSGLTSLWSMFINCSSLKVLDLSSFDTKKVTLTTTMFQGCTNLKAIYVGGGWDMSKVTTSPGMFDGCTSIVGCMGTTYDANHIDKAYAHIDGGSGNPGYLSEKGAPYAALSSDGKTLTFYCDGKNTSHTETTFSLNEGDGEPAWFTSASTVTTVVFDESFAIAKPTSMFGWFATMTNLTTLTGLENLNTKSVTNMGLVFYGCSSLTTLDLSSFDTRSVTNMGGMFWNCTSLQRLDLSSFNTQNVTDMSGMFQDCSMLRTIYATYDWNRSGNTMNMFQGCTSIVGGMGTTYAPDHIDGEYARIDELPRSPGYFSEKPAFLRGDVNGDGHVSIADVSALIDYLLSGETAPAGADCNQSGNVSIADVSSLIDYLLSGQWP